MKIKTYSPKYNRIDYLVEFDESDEGKTDEEILKAVENKGDYNGPRSVPLGGKVIRYSKDHAIVTVYTD